ncbi:DUF5723 family protein [Tenacibaculum sp. 190524A02b]|uniref:DUF5723 family protein n=1 Tax=Tenacibaculum vairaonense TaxID=3137860 RepID=UPI0031FADE95
MRKLVIIITFLILGIKSVYAQNKQVLYNFDEIPQTLLLNPGTETNYRFHAGIPLLSGISMNFGVTGATVADLFRQDGVDFNVKYRNVLNKLTADDYVQIHSQIDVLNGGYRLNDRDYLSAGFYTEIDAYATVPKDVLTLLNEGNEAYLNRSFLISQANIKAEALGVLHVGLTRKLSSKLTVGARFKLYSGIVNVTSTNNAGSFSTRLGEDNIYEHYLNGINVTGYTSGVNNGNNVDKESDISASKLLGRSFLGGNLGVGFDIGMTYHLNPQTEITASLLDIGFVSYSEDIRNFTVKGNYIFSGINFQYDNTNPDYWGDLDRDFNSKVVREENTESYTVMRPIKFNSSIRHQWGKSRNEESCSDISYKDYYNNAVGAQLFSVIRPVGPKFALTGFYETRLLEGLKTKITYTVDDFSYSNVGIGLSAKLGIVNIYGMVDNLLKVTDIADAHNASFQLGFNLIFK